MDVKTLCLAILSRGPASGYAIKKEFESGATRHFSNAGFGSIYPALKLLHAQGLIRNADENLAKCCFRSDAKVYELTAKGRETLVKALQKPHTPDRYHSDFQVSLFYGQFLTPEFRDRLIQDRIHYYRDEIRLMEEALQAGEQMTAGERYLLGLGLDVYRTALTYLETHPFEEAAETQRHAR